MRFKDSIVLITGGVGGMGKAASKRFLEEGATVIMVDLNEQRGQEVLEEFNKQYPSCAFFPCDITNPQAIQALFEFVDRKYGKLDVLYNNAGISIGSGLENTTIDEWDATMNVNLKSAFLMTRAALPLLRKGNKKAVVNTASQLAVIAAKNNISYVCSKAALLQFTKAAALDLAGEGIRVNAVCPAGTNTDILRHDITGSRFGNTYEEAVKSVAAMYPIGRIAEPEDIAPAVLFLASEEASFITGAHIMIDGGNTIK